MEAAWITGRWDKLQGYLELCAKEGNGDFNVGIGCALNALLQSRGEAFSEIINELRLNIARAITANSVTSLQSCHDDMLKLHALSEVDSIANARTETVSSYAGLLHALDRRLDVLGGYLSDKQYLLGLRRAAMELSCVLHIRDCPLVH